MKIESENRIAELNFAEIDAVNGAGEDDSYWGGVGKIALGVGAVAAGVATGGTAVIVASVIVGAYTAYQGYDEASGALESAGK
ncbi:MAG: hypothetical protein ABJ205_07670 [Erythrobacter sp.]|uniref:hypothetical protein n=1 Tax=Erythrobacter sp. TaxID=1042 RepID=UPI003267D1B5